MANGTEHFLTVCDQRVRSVVARLGNGALSGGFLAGVQPFGHDIDDPSGKRGNGQTDHVIANSVKWENDRIKRAGQTAGDNTGDEGLPLLISGRGTVAFAQGDASFRCSGLCALHDDSIIVCMFRVRRFRA